MGKSLGIAAFVLLMISLPIPIVGNYITFLALIILCAAAYQGDKTWTVVVDLISWVKVFFLSPTLHFAMFGSSYARGFQQYAARTNQQMGIRDTGLDHFIDQNASAMEKQNGILILIVLALLIAPLAIMGWRSRMAQPAAVKKSVANFSDQF